jgi:hypothetical protein
MERDLILGQLLALQLAFEQRDSAVMRARQIGVAVAKL